MTLGEMVRAAREAAGLTLRGLSARVGRSHSYVADVENNRKGITVEFAGRLAEVLSLPLSELLGRAGVLSPELWRYLARTPAMVELLEEARELDLSGTDVEWLRLELRRRAQLDRDLREADES